MFDWWIIFISDIQDYFEFIIKKHENFSENPPIQIYPNKIKNSILFKIRMQIGTVISRNNETIREYKKDIDKDRDREDVPKLESVEVVLVHCSLVNNSYQQASKVLFTFVPTKRFGQLITISPHLLTTPKSTNAEFESIELWFTDQNNRPLEIEDSINITLIIG